MATGQTLAGFGPRNACQRQILYSGAAMPIFRIRHVTTYHYHQPVAFGEHRMMLRPRDDHDQKILELELEITPTPRDLTWTRDRFGNHVATASFAEPAAELRFDSSIRLDHAPGGFQRGRHRGLCPDLSLQLPCSRISAAKIARSAQPSRGRGLVRRSTATSWRSTSSSASFDAEDRPSRISQSQTRTKMR